MENIEKTAALSKIELSETECENMKKELSSILDMFKVLDEVSLGESEPYTDSAALRDDDWKESYPGESMLKNAPESNEGFIIVPRTVG